jgi:hypothetical protein
MAKTILAPWFRTMVNQNVATWKKQQQHKALKKEDVARKQRKYVRAKALSQAVEDWFYDTKKQWEEIARPEGEPLMFKPFENLEE